MAETLASQQQYQRVIQRALINLKKVGRDNWTKALLRTRILHLMDQWRLFQAGDIKLSMQHDDDQKKTMAYFTEEQFDATEADYLAALAFMTEQLDKLSGNVSTELSSAVGPSPTDSAARLPCLELPHFDGRYEKWEAFRDRFSALIVLNPSLAQVNKMQYLVSALQGCALECIANLAVTADNFDIAWKSLTDRFENPRRLLSCHLTSLLNLPSLPRESAQELQELRDQVCVLVASVKNLGRTPQQLWDDMLVHLVTQKLDVSTRKAWTIKTSDDMTHPSFETLKTFLDARVRALEEFGTSAPRRVNPPLAPPPTKSPVGSTRVHTSTASVRSSPPSLACPLCRSSHRLTACSKFNGQSPRERRETAKTLGRCFNCLSQHHSIRDCTSQYSCRVCSQRHHSLLHIETERSAPHRSESSAQSSTPSAEVKSHLASTTLIPNSVLLATAWVTLRVPSGRCVTVRALLDQGSECSFVAASMVALLRAPRTRVSTSISAVGGVHAGTVRHSVRLLVAPRDSDGPTVTTTALVLPSLSTYKPNRCHDQNALTHLSDLKWADPDPTSPIAIQILLGADIFSSVLLHGVRKGRCGQPIAQNTIFGWIISGPITSGRSDTRSPISSRDSIPPSTPLTTHHCVHDDTLSTDLRRFWETEEIPASSLLSPDEEQCELHFQRHTRRTADGRYLVRLPFRNPPPLSIGQSRLTAEKVLRSIQRKFRVSPSLAAEYCEFLHEYEALGHMRPASSPSPTDQCVYIPHHPVIREDSVTTHLRVVFNASSVTSNGSTLNDQLFSGPKLQQDLSVVILRWRTFRLVYTADIAKMYRQILVDERDVNYQRILWNPHSSRDPRDFQLLTVTYGMTCAPFLALRVLRQLVTDEGARYPQAGPVLNSHTYVDDILYGGDDLAAIRHSRDQLIALLQLGKFSLRKWASNSPDFLSDMDPSDHGLACTKDLSQDDRIKVLGIRWNPSDDTFQFHVTLSETIPSTKRAILSTIAKLYDPLGWVTPAIISAKILIQNLWRLNLGWDDPIPAPSLSQWTAIYSRLSLLNELKIPRWIGLTPAAPNIELHGFADASTVAYSAVVYARCISPAGDPTVSLLAAKTKVAPLVPLTIPRLELQAAALLARLLNFVASSLDLLNCSLFCWTDSTVALAWLTSHPSRWKTFVANRVADVQTRLPHAIWRHVPTAQNPADSASRGLPSDELLRLSLWWHGPAWLRSAASEWPFQPSFCTGEEKCEMKVATYSVTVEPEWDLSSRYSTWPKLIRVTAYVQRFVQRARRNRPVTPGVPNGQVPNGQALTAAEITAAKRFWLRKLQRAMFPDELIALGSGAVLSARSKLASLNPFLDENGLLRVGGRLRNSSLPLQSKHPIVLSNHALVRLIVEYTHVRALHSGLLLTLASLREEFWILRARSLVKSVIRSCVRCVRERAAVPSQIMGDLPQARVTPSRPFAHCGVDYAGPMQVRASAGRGIRSRKAYIALFVCLSTKAIHLELVGDYSTSAFLNAYIRFCARRGLPENVYSDNGTTFVGACRDLTASYRAALRDPVFQNRIAGDGVAWHFIPPSAPHFGGLWEAGVKSVKHHLRRVLGDRTLTYEEFTTLLSAIEACLNSRPLAPLSDTLDDYEPLTPAHFLVGSALTVPPQPSLLDIAENRLSRWQLVRHATERFWKLWQTDYLNTLQQRSKWRRARPSITVGQLVLLRNATLPPCKWELGRVTHLHPGDDGHIRVITVKTATSTFKRPIVKVCPLPVTCETATA